MENLAADATPEQVGVAYAELTAAQMALTAAENLPENIAASQPVPPTELEKAQIAADEAATAAMTAAVTAKASADDADAARADVATMQTNESSGGHAYMARHYADIAQTAYMTAKTASEAAADATTVSAAVEARVAAVAAKKEAVDAEIDATKHAGLAVDDAANELFVDGTVKSVGGTMLDANAAASTRTEDGQKTETGLIESLNPMHTAMLSPGVLGVARNDGEDITYVAPEAGAMARPFAIGKTVDSPDDLARLMIVTQYVTQYADSRTVKVYALLDADELISTEPNTVRIIDDDYDLTPVGAYYLADGHHHQMPQVSLEGTGVVAKDAEAEQVYYYVRWQKTRANG